MGTTRVVNIALAEEIGLKEAMVLQQIHYWMGKKPHKREGKLWVYNTYNAWHKQFLCWSIISVKRALWKLRDLDLLYSENYNKSKQDKTRWYSINYNHPILKEFPLVAPDSVETKCTSAEIKLNPRMVQNEPPQSSKCTSALCNLIQSYQYNNNSKVLQKNNKKIPIRGGLDRGKIDSWLASLSTTERNQVKGRVESIINDRRSEIRSIPAYRYKLYEKIMKGEDLGFQFVSDNRIELLRARHYG